MRNPSPSARLQKEIQQLKTKLALGGGGGAAADDDRIEIAGSTLIAREVQDVDKESLRALADTLKSRLKSGVIVLAAAMPDGKVSLIASVTPDLSKKAPAGQLVKAARANRRRRWRRPSRTSPRPAAKMQAKLQKLIAEAQTLVRQLLE